MNKPKFNRYNDGVVKVYKERENKNEFNAKRNVKTLDDMDYLGKLDYEEMSKREQDIEFAERNDFSLSLKIKTRLVPFVDNTCKVVINNYLYAVSYVDKTRSECFLYLEGVKEI